MKKCCKCKKETDDFSPSEFKRKTSTCRECVRERHQIYYNKKKEYLREQKRKYYSRDEVKEHVKIFKKEYARREHVVVRKKNYDKKRYENNRDEVLLSRKKSYLKLDREKKNTRQKEHYYLNHEKVREKSNARQRARRKEDPVFKLKCNLRTRLYVAVRKGKPGSSVKDLGCTIEELRIHLESKFEENMSWDNYGKWHIDHIKPLASFDLSIREELLIACHYTNLQPLWALDNIKKGSK